MSRTRRTALSVATGLVVHAGMLLLGFVTTPLLIRWLGDERLGAFRAASDWAGYLALLDLGIPAALQVLLARAYSGKDEPATDATIAAGMRAYLRVCALMVLAGAVLAVAVPRLVQVGPDSVVGLQVGFLLGLLPVLWQPVAALRYLEESSQRGYVVSSLLLVQSALISGSSLLFAWLGLGLPGQFLAATLGSLAFHAGLAWRSRRRLPGVFRALRTGEGVAPLRGEMTALRWPGFWQQLCGRVSMLTDNILVAAFLGPADVVRFIVSQRLVSMVGGQAGSIGGHAWASLAELYYQGKRDLLNVRLIELTRLTAVLVLTGVIPTAVFTPVFVRLWVGSDHYGGELLPWLAAGNTFLLGILSLWGCLMNGTGFLRRMLPLEVVQALLNVALSVLATWSFGLPGPILGTFLAMIGVYLARWPFLLRECFGTPLRPLTGAIVRPLCVAVPYAVGLRTLAAEYAPTGWVSLAAALAISALAYLALAWFFALNLSQRSELRQRVRVALAWHPG